MNVILIFCDTLRRDHCGPYNFGRPLNECGHPEQPSWTVPTPNIDRLARRGVIFENAWCGSTPCMPARRDIYTGRYEFLERGWGPLEDDDLDLPRMISGPPNQSLSGQAAQGFPVSYLITDHYHLWEQGAGNYHMGYSGFEFIRGHESDAWRTDQVDFPCPAADRAGKLERHYRNVFLARHAEEDRFCARVFRQASDWLQGNLGHESFFLHIDCFDPHEPWDAPADLVGLFDPRGPLPHLSGMAPYAPWRGRLSEDELRNYQARYAAHVVLVDRWLGRFLDALDHYDLWRNTMVILTSDHGTFNGDHGRLGKMQTHEHGSVGRIPFLIVHPACPGGQRRKQPVQLVDLYPTILKALCRPVPPDRHGIDLLPVLEEPHALTRDCVLAGQFGKSVTISDGEWILHQSPPSANEPLYWYGHCLARFLPYELGPYADGRRRVLGCESWPEQVWLGNLRNDPGELVNLAETEPAKLQEMRLRLRETLSAASAPEEQLVRLGLVN